jgi:hypothetical protein
MTALLICATAPWSYPKSLFGTKNKEDMPISDPMNRRAIDR